MEDENVVISEVIEEVEAPSESNWEETDDVIDPDEYDEDDENVFDDDEDNDGDFEENEEEEYED